MVNVALPEETRSCKPRNCIFGRTMLTKSGMIDANFQDKQLERNKFRWTWTFTPI